VRSIAGVGTYPYGGVPVTSQEIDLVRNKRPDLLERYGTLVGPIQGSFDLPGVHSKNEPLLSDELQSAARAYMHACGLEPTPDAVDQLTLVFLKCLKIMCERPWDPNGHTWRRAGVFGVLTDTRKKFERLWERFWIHGVRHDDSAFDLINYVGMVLRADPASGWGEWGEPGVHD
jgi:hypothetical protein